ncbi:Omp28-related outer membrane protein [Flavobacterium sp. JP2137]|uniref:Omp28-related outer membrane protein n=1 Tax=Flavobacterium sp. JP2137 TaxID=3414510 RepID=UPI003D2FBCE9
MDSITKFTMKLVLLFGLTISCSSSDDSNPDPKLPEPKPASITLTSSRTSSTLDENVTYVFTVKDEKGVDVSEFVDFKINDTPFPSNQFKPEALGEYKVIANWNGLTSNSLTITVTAEPIDTKKNFVHKVLIEDFTGAGCGWCPRVSYAIEKAEADSDKIIPVAIHNTVYGPDPFNYIGRLVLENKLRVNSSYPTAFINRTIKWKGPEDANYKFPSTYLKESSPIGIKISSNLSNASGTANVSLYFKETYQDIKYVAYIVEDGLKYKQTNYTSFYGGASTLPDFIHNNTLRATAGSILGEVIPASASVVGGTLDLNINFTNYKSEDVSKLKVVIIIVDDKGLVLNVQRAQANTTNSFEYAN